MAVRSAITATLAAATVLDGLVRLGNKVGECDDLSFTFEAFSTK